MEFRFDLEANKENWKVSIFYEEKKNKKVLMMVLHKAQYIWLSSQWIQEMI